jgi:hypothetical protein
VDIPRTYRKTKSNIGDDGQRSRHIDRDLAGLCIRAYSVRVAVVPNRPQGLAEGQLKDVGDDGYAHRHEHEGVHGANPPALFTLDPDKHVRDADLGEGKTPWERWLGEEKPFLGKHLLMIWDVVIVSTDAVVNGYQHECERNRIECLGYQ